MSVTVTPFLRNALLLDAAVSAAAGLLMIAVPGFLADLLALPRPLLVGAALVIFVWVAMLGVASLRPALPRPVVSIFVAGNAIWTAASFAIMIFGLVQPNLLGVLFISAQALAVGLFAVLQWKGARDQEGAFA